MLALLASSAFVPLSPAHLPACRSVVQPALSRLTCASEQEEAAGADLEPVPSGSWADDGGWDDTWQDSDDPASSWLSPTPTTAPAPPPAPRRPIEATTVGMVTGPFQRRNGYHVEVLVQHEGAGRESLHHLFVSNEVLIETAALKGREQWDLEVGPFAEAVVSYLQQQGVELDDPDWGMQDDSVPYSHEHVTVRTLFNYYPDLKDHLAESLIPEVGPAPCTRGTAQCLCCERASAGGPAWWLPKGTRCSHALSGGRGSRGAAREPAGGRPSREGSPTFCIPGHTQRPEAVGARLVGGADAAARRLRPRAGRGGQGVDRQARGGRAEISGGGAPRCPRACPRGRRGRGSRGRMRRRSRRG
jgi:hypothetical protein